MMKAFLTPEGEAAFSRVKLFNAITRHERGVTPKVEIPQPDKPTWTPSEGSGGAAMHVGVEL